MDLDKLLPVQIGNRTQILALAIAVLAILQAAGLITPEHFSQCLAILAPLGAATLAAKIERPQGAPPPPALTIVAPAPAAPVPPNPPTSVP